MFPVPFAKEDPWILAWALTNTRKSYLSPSKKSKLTEIERWKEVYSILFRIPIDSPEMPSPCK